MQWVTKIPQPGDHPRRRQANERIEVVLEAFGRAEYITTAKSKLHCHLFGHSSRGRNVEFQVRFGGPTHHPRYGEVYRTHHGNGYGLRRRVWMKTLIAGIAKFHERLGVLLVTVFCQGTLEHFLQRLPAETQHV